MDQINNHVPLIGDYAPGFRGLTTQGEIDFPKDYKGKWVVFFSHPGDYTPVCTTEFMVLASMIKAFQNYNTQLVGLSVDSIHSHIGWLRKIKELSWRDMKQVDVTFPVVEDVRMEIARLYGMLHDGSSHTQTVRGVFIIDPKGKIRAIQYYPSAIGRNMEEILRMIIALQKVDEENVLIPANWKPGDDVIVPPPNTCQLANERMEKVYENGYCLDWFLCFRQSGDPLRVVENGPEFNPYPSSYIAKNWSNSIDQRIYK